MMHLFSAPLDFRSSVEWRKSRELIRERLSRAASEPRVIRQVTFIPRLPNTYAHRGRSGVQAAIGRMPAQFCRIVVNSLRF